MNTFRRRRAATSAQESHERTAVRFIDKIRLREIDRPEIIFLAFFIFTIILVESSYFFKDTPQALLSNTVPQTENERDLGLVCIGEVAPYSFSVANPTGIPLTIRRAVPMCSCAKVSTPANTIAPGTAITVVGTISVSEEGIRKVAINIETTSEVVPVLRYNLRWTGVRSLRLEPQRLFFPPKRNSEVMERIVSLRSNGELSGTILNILKPNSPTLTIVSPSKEEPTDQFTVQYAGTAVTHDEILEVHVIDSNGKRRNFALPVHVESP